MRKTDVLKAIVTLFIIFLFGVLLFNHKDNERNSGVEVGEIWCEIINEKNPFKKIEYRCSKVIDVKNGYVKYLKLPDRYTSSTTISAFKWNSKKIK